MLLNRTPSTVLVRLRECARILFKFHFCSQHFNLTLFINFSLKDTEATSSVFLLFLSILLDVFRGTQLFTVKALYNIFRLCV